MQIKKLLNYLNSDYRAVALDIRGLHKLDDEEFLKRKFRLVMGYDLNLENPKTLNEKLQWLKLHDRKPIYTTMVDKYEVKKYISDKVGEKYVVPTLGVWDKFESINFNTLPQQFVLKCTHDSGGVIICKDKRQFDYKEAEKKINNNLKQDFYRLAREWPYKNVQPRIIAEMLLQNEDSSPLVDYKVYTYGGKPIYFMYSLGEAEHNVRNHKFDTKGNSIDYLFKKQKVIDENDIVLPDNLDEMMKIAEKLCEGTQHLRVDLFNIAGKIYVGELTFYSGGGYISIDSAQYSNYLAGLIDTSAIEGKGEDSD